MGENKKPNRPITPPSVKERPAGKAGTPSKFKNDFILDEDEKGEYCVIPVSGKDGLYAKIDPEDYEKIAKYKWCALRTKAGVYARRSKRVNGKVTTILMHREIINTKEGVGIDHRSGDTLDNRRENLRVADKSQNAMNAKIQKHTFSKYKGVSSAGEKRGKKYRAQLMYKGEFISIGYYKTEKEAAEAYDREAKKYFGEFARLNFPEKDKPVNRLDISFRMDEKDRAAAIRNIRNLRGRDSLMLDEIIGNMAMKEVSDMCIILTCNISKLTEKINEANYDL